MAASGVPARPCAWPLSGSLRPEHACLMILDTQEVFCEQEGVGKTVGPNMPVTTAPIQPIKRVLEACRQWGCLVIHARQGKNADLSALPANNHRPSEQFRTGSTDPRGGELVHGEPGWQVAPELAPLPGEPIINRPEKGSFYDTDLDHILRCRCVRKIILAGGTTDAYVHGTMRDTKDRGYDCLLLSDCTGATDPSSCDAALKVTSMQGSMLGAVCSSSDFIAAIQQPADTAVGLRQPLLASGGPSCKVASARPYPYLLPLRSTALVMIDFQRDFLCEGGFGAALGNDVSLLQAALPAAQRLLAAARTAGLLVLHTLEAHQPDLSDLPPSKLNRGNLPSGLRIGDRGEMGRILVAGELGNGIVEEVAPIEGEWAIHKPGKGAFYATGLHEKLQAAGITHLIFAGVTAEVCVQTSMREANDRGYECLLVTDATESYIPRFKSAVIDMIHAQGGIVGWTAEADAVISALSARLTEAAA